MRQSPAFRLMAAASWLAPPAWRDHQEQAILGAARAGPDWDRFVDLTVSRHRTPVVAWAALRRTAGLDIPATVRQRLEQETVLARQATVRHLLTLKRVFATFDQAGLQVMPLKGPLLSLDLYGNPAMRQAHDLDFACPLAHLRDGIACLRELGFGLKDESILELTPRQWRAFLRHEYHLGFIHLRDGTQVELHWREPGETPAMTAQCWRRSVAARWHEESFRQMAPTDRILYLCRHGSRHAWFRIKWISDLAMLWAAGRIDAAACFERAREVGLGPVFLASLALLEVLYGLPIPPIAGADRVRIPAFLEREPLDALAGEFACEPRLGLAGAIRYHTSMFRLASPSARPEMLSRLAYQREDYQFLQLPDRLFWLYPLLRPALFVCRKLRPLAPAVISQPTHAHGPYALCGWRVRSEVPLPELSPWDPSILPARELSIHLRDVPAPPEGHFALTAAGDILLHVPGQFRIEIPAAKANDADEVRVRLEQDADPVLVRSFLYGTVLAALCYRRGLLPLHASSVQMNGAAVIFSGPSGSGKSTLATALARRGHRLLSDDVCAIDLRDPAQPLLWPAIARVKLRADAIDAFELGPAAVYTRAGREEKGHFGMAADWDAVADPSPVPIAAIYALDTVDELAPGRRSLSGRDRFLFLAGQAHRGAVAQALGLERSLFEQLTALARAVPTYQLLRPRSLEALDPLADYLETAHGVESTWRIPA